MARKNKNTNNGATLGFEETLWQAANKMRGHMDPSEYKHVCLGNKQEQRPVVAGNGQ